jgi:hypothetical protein
MSDLTVWWLPDAKTEWGFVARGKRGICYSLPNVPNGWRVRVVWPDGTAPTCEPLPDVAARVIGWRLKLRGVTEPTTADLTAYGAWTAQSKAKQFRLDAEAAADDELHGLLGAYKPTGEPERERPRRHLNFGVPAEVLS